MLFTIDPFLPENRTKTALDSENGLSMVWSDADLVGVFPKTGYQKSFTLSAGNAGLSSAAFSGGNWAMENGLDYCAYYPFDIANSNSSECKTHIPVTYLGQSQTSSTCSSGSFDYAYSEWKQVSGDSLNFTLHHIGALACIRLLIPQDGTYTGLRLDVPGDLLPVTGSYDLTSDCPVFVPDTYASSITMELRDYTAMAGDTGVLYLMLPPCDISDTLLTVSLLMKEGYYLFDLTPKRFEPSVRYDMDGTLAKVGTRGAAKARYKDEDTYVNWVQLWPGGPRFAEHNLEEYGTYQWTESKSEADVARVMWANTGTCLPRPI